MGARDDRGVLRGARGAVVVARSGAAVTVEGTAFRNRSPCTRCGDVGEQVWIGAEDGLCAPCRKGAPPPAPAIVLARLAPTLGEEGAKAGALATSLDGCEVESAEDFTAYAAALAEAKGSWKRLDDLEKSITRPIREGLDAVRALFAVPKGHYAALETTLKGALGRATTTASVEGLAARSSWDFEVTHPDAVPRDLCTPDVKKLRAHIQDAVKNGAEPEAPGVRFFLTTRIASRSR